MTTSQHILARLNQALRTAHTPDGRFVTTQDIARVTPLSAGTWRRILGGGINLRIDHLDMFVHALTQLSDSIVTYQVKILVQAKSGNIQATPNDQDHIAIALVPTDQLDREKNHA